MSSRHVPAGPYSGVLSTRCVVGAKPHENKPKSCPDNTEFAIALTGILSGCDISFYWADIYDDMSHTEFISMGPPPLIEQRHSRLKMYVADINIALGNWLLKTETAYIDGFEFFTIHRVKSIPE